MIQEEINHFIDNFKYFTVLLGLCFNTPTPLESISSVSIEAKTPHPPIVLTLYLNTSLCKPSRPCYFLATLPPTTY